MAGTETSMRTAVQQAVQAHVSEAAELSLYLLNHPEVSGEEYASSKKIVELLQARQFQVTYPFAGYPTAFHALLDNGEGPEVAFLVEYDALAGLGHGCGHNLHGALSVLAGLGMMDLRQKFKGKLHVIGTPAEEENGAKIGMADQGVFDRMSMAIMMHSWYGGKARADMDALSLRHYFVTFTGKSAHAVAAPWEGHSALAAARKFLDLVDARRECFTPDIHVNAVFTEGGKQPNILPDKAELRLEFRTSSLKSLQRTDEMVRKCAEGAALALDCKAEFQLAFEFADMVRNAVLETEAERMFRAYGIAVAPVDEASGSSDVGNVSYHCPAVQPLIPIMKEMCALHTPEFRDATALPEAEKAMEKGACILAEMALRVFNDAAFREEIKAAQEKSLAAKL